MSKFEIFNNDDENNSKDKSKSPESPYYRLLKSRVITINDAVDSKLAKEVNAQLLFLEQEDPEKEITVFINSPGGEIFSGFSIFDTMNFVQPKVRTVAAGLCASIAIIILLGGEKGQRFAFPNSRLLIHQPSVHGQIYGQASDLEIAANEIMMAKEKINQIISTHTGQSMERVVDDTERDYWLSPEESIEYGLIDKIITNRSDIA
ncbi:MAG: ATP-dependent Clp protease proteolytic subunit [Calditrichaeota bacterium]|nr:MAG: ATP-dependent Clp protease proteolytic subunit [Calditrichota bacterium]